MSEQIKTVIRRIKNQKDPFKQARLIRYLKEQGVKVKDIAGKLERSPSYISNLVRILKLPDIVVDGYYAKHISLSHLMAISRMKERKSVVSTYEKILSEGSTVAETEELVREILYDVKPEGEKASEKVKNRIREELEKIDEDLKVKITQTRIRARVVLEMRGSVKKTSETLRKLAGGLEDTTDRDS